MQFPNGDPSATDRSETDSCRCTCLSCPDVECYLHPERTKIGAMTCDDHPAIALKFGAGGWPECSACLADEHDRMKGRD